MAYLSDCQLHQCKYLIDCRQYQMLADFLVEKTAIQEPRVFQWLDLALACQRGDMKAVDQLAPILGQEVLLAPDYLVRRTYSFLHHLDLQFHRQEYGDYFRALSPVLVDIFRMIAKRHIIPQLDEFIEWIYKETLEGDRIYRGIQWKQDRVEASDNIIHETFRRYYGDRFNYDHYVSSSHLLKIIQDHGSQPEILAKVDKIRQVEKYIRNIAAHEIVYIHDAWVQDRVHMTLEEIHQLVQDLVALAGLTDSNQWQVFHQVDQALLNLLTPKE